MEPTGSGQSQVPIYAVIALILAASGVFILEQPLQSFRPLRPAEELPLVTAEIEARLWEDPLATVRRRINQIAGQTAAGGIQLEELIRKLSTLCEKPDVVYRDIHTCLESRKERLLILPVMLPGGYTANDHETRLRTRYAVLTALESAGYTPSHPERIKVARIPPSPQKSASSVRRAKVSQ